MNIHPLVIFMFALLALYLIRRLVFRRERTRSYPGGQGYSGGDYSSGGGDGGDSGDDGCGGDSGGDIGRRLRGVIRLNRAASVRLCLS